MSAKEVRVGDIGTRLEVTVFDGDGVADLSSVVEKQFVLRKPNGQLVEKSALFASDGKDGKLYYIVADGDLDRHGIWQMQVRLVFPNGQWKSDIVSFEVHKNL